MSRPVRKKQVPNKLDSNLFIVNWKLQRHEQNSINDSKISTRNQETKKTQISSTPHVLSSKLRSNHEVIPSNTATTNSSRNTVSVKKRSSQRGSILRCKSNISDKMNETGKRSHRLKARSSEKGNLTDKKNERVIKLPSENNRDTRLRERNKSRENNSHSSDQAAGHSETDPSEEKTEIPVSQNKFFKSKVPSGKNSPKIRLQKNIVLQKRVNNRKRVNNNQRAKVNDSIGFIPALRQTTLSESFKRSSRTTRLRPRKIVKDHVNSPGVTAILERSISPDKRKSFVLLEKIDRPQEGGKVPVYKSVKLLEKNTEDKESVYEFEFDANDPYEEKNGNKTRKKKRAPRKAAPTRKKKVLYKKDNNMPTKLIESSKTSSVTKENKKAVVGCDHVEKDELPRVGIGNEKDDTAGCDHGENNELPRAENPNYKNDIESCNQNEQTEAPHVGIENNNQSLTKENVCPENLPLRENVRINDTKPKITAMETLTGDKKVSFKPALSLTRQNLTKFNPFRSTQSIFKPRLPLNPKDMMDHSLLNKSLSPIKNDTTNFDVASPWRPQIGSSFSSVKQVVQSTPRIDRNLTRPSLAELKQQTQQIPENDENENITVVGGDKPNPVIKESDKNRLLKPLGNRISNAENIQANSNTAGDVCKIGERKSFGQFLSYGENKQRAGFGDRLYKSPIKNEQAVTMNRGSMGLKMRNQEQLSPASLTKKLGPRLCTHDNDNENLPPVEESMLLKQSNLNSFLNIDDIPESTMITTSHGIFGDANSTSIVSSKLLTKATVENCFGFDDDHSDSSESPVKIDKKKTTTPVKKVFERLKKRVLPTQTEPVVKPSRISLGEIKNTLHPRKKIKLNNPELKEDKKERKPAAGTIKVSEDKPADALSKNVSNAAQFCDTFDILLQSENGTDTGKSSVAEVGLFADLEPVHFTQPPRWSYTKKRERIEYWSSENEEDSDDQEEKPIRKKKKLTKLQKENDKKIDEWVKSVNDTFQEIDEFDLVVEKRS